MPASPRPNHTGQLAGRVMTADGAAVRDAAVMLTGESPPHKDIAALTDTHGRFQFDDLVPGTYTVLVNAEGYASQTKTVTVFPGQTAKLTFVLTTEELEP